MEDRCNYCNFDCILLSMRYTIMTFTTKVMRTQTSIKIKVLQPLSLFMAGRPYIFLSCRLFFFFPSLISAVGDWMSAIFHTWCGLSANLGCRSATCCTRLAGNAGRQKIAKNSPSAHRRTTLSGYIFATMARIDSWKHSLPCWTEGATCIRQGGHHVGHWPTFLVKIYFYDYIT